MPRQCADFLVSCVILVLALALSSRAVADESLEIRVDDEQGSLIPCRVHLRNQRGEVQRPEGLPFWSDHFVCPGKAVLKLPTGDYEYEIERGPEYLPVTGTLSLRDDGQKVEETLRRISSLRQNGWYSGDLHVHRPAKDIELLMRAEDLDFAPVIDWWNARGGNVPPVEQTTKTFDGHRVYQVCAGEDEREGGALLYFGLDTPLNLSVKSREFPSPMKFVGEAHGLNPNVWIDIEKPFWWDVPTWLASGQMNSIGLANNHMCRSQMFESEAWGRPRNAGRLPAPRGNGFWTQEIYYHALDAGLKIPPSAGSASGVLPNPVGYNRVYVHLGEEKLTPESWFQGLAKGRCFVTNGPLLSVSANEHPPGYEFKSAGGTQVDLNISLVSSSPVSEIEVIQNGKIAQRISCTGDTSQNLRARLTLEGPGWFLVRSISDVDHTFRFASTAPWYVAASDGELRVSRSSAQFFLDWVEERIDRIRATVNDERELRSVLEPHENARLFWKTRVDAAAAEDEDANSIPSTSASASRLPQVSAVEIQPLLASTQRLMDSMDYIGSPLSTQVTDELKKLRSTDHPKQLAGRIQKLLDPLCLAAVSLRRTGPPAVTRGKAAPELLEQGWRTFLIKVINRPGHTKRLEITSPNAQPLPHAPADQVKSRWMQLSSFEGRPLKADLSGLELEYRIVQIYSRDPGRKQGLLEFGVSAGTDEGGALIREWRFDEGKDGWSEMNQVEIEMDEGSLNITSTGNDPFMGAEVQSPSGPMMLRFWAKTDVEGVGQLFWWTKEIPQPTGQRQTNFLLEPGKEHLYEVPFHSEGELAGVRLDPLVKPGTMRIDWIDLVSAGQIANRARLNLDFDCREASKVTFRVIDADGLPAFARFEIRDDAGQIYPTQSKRLAPDFFFQRHIYRGDGESVSLPPGDYTIRCSRGPETIGETKELKVGDEPAELVYRVDRWIDPSRAGWWSGDHHIHAAGCLHYQNPTQGVEPADMIRHIMGEDLKVGCCLTWGPCFDFQKRFFTGEVAEQSKYPYTLRYDVEVSGFGSHASGHLNLLNLKEQIYPGGESKDHWPTLGLNTLKWAKRQGAVCGPAHSSIGLTHTIGRLPDTPSKDGLNSIPNFFVPAYDGIGANEFVMDVTHNVPGPDGKPVPAVDFISTMNTERVAEWNMWYHVLNCGFRVAASGETDFPCMSGERVGIGRVYAKVDGRLTFDKWVRSIGAGRSYVSDGRCQLLDFQAHAIKTDRHVDVGVDGSELRLGRPGRVRLSTDGAALIDQVGYVLVELIVNGYPVASKSMKADGSIRKVEFEHQFEQSGWATIRVFPNAHTNPVYVVVGDKPVRGTVDSARWCLAGVEQCWKSKQPTYAADEQADAKAAYDHARRVYQQLIDEHPDNQRKR